MFISISKRWMCTSHDMPHTPADAGVRANRRGGVTHGASECGPMRRLDGQAPESTTIGGL